MALSDLYPSVKVEAAFSVGSSGYLILDDETYGLLDTATLGPDDDEWTDISAYVMGVSTSRGRERMLDRYRAGKADVQLNNRDGRFSRHNSAGPYVSGGVSGVRPMRPIRVSATWDGTDYILFTGFADRWPSSRTSFGLTVTRLKATDAFKVFARNEGVPQSPVGAGETTGARINRILDEIGWSATKRNIDTGRSTVQATELSQNALGEMQLVADTEQGAFYIDENGYATFENRHALLENERSATVQATFGSPADGDLPYADPEIGDDDDLLVNKVQIARDGGTVQVVQDQQSIALNQLAVYNRTDLLNETDEEVADTAGWILRQFKDPEQRIESIVIEPAQDPDVLWPVALGARIRDRIRVKATNLDGDDLDLECFIEGISHKVSTKPFKWETKFTLSLAEAYGGFLVLDHASLGQLDSNALAY